MRKGKPLRRRTGLKTNTPLRTTKPLKRVSIVPGKSTVNPTRMKPWRPTQTPEERAARKIVQKRSLVDGVRMCELAIPGTCLGRATNYSHRVNASQGGLYAAGWALDSCGSGTTGCHGNLHASPAKGYENGWLVKSWDNPLTRPVLYRGRWVLLDNDGRVFPSPDPGGTTDGC